jgi:hypothetical protein
MQWSDIGLQWFCGKHWCFYGHAVNLSPSTGLRKLVYATLLLSHFFPKIVLATSPRVVNNPCDGKPKTKQTMKTKTTIDGKQIGCWIDECSGSADTLNQRTVELAVEDGMELSEDDRKLLARFDYDVTKEDDSQQLSEFGDEAIDYLNSLDLPAYSYFYFEENCLFLGANVEDVRESVGFVSSRKQDEPETDYRGEWLHVSDHGNVTLYIRGEDGKDTEVWGIV